MRIKVSGFADEASKQFDEQLALWKREGLQYLEFRSFNGVNVSALDERQLSVAKSALDANGIFVSAIGSPVGKTPLEDPFADVAETMKKVLHAAYILEANYVRVFSFYPPEDGEPDGCSSEVVDRMGTLAEMAQDAGVTLVHENERGIYGDTADRCLHLMTQVCSPSLRMCFDPGNMVFVVPGGEIYREYRKIKPYVEYIHAKDASRALQQFVPVGEGDGDCVKIFADLAASQWQGFISVEPHLGKRFPYLRPDESLVLALRALQYCLNDMSNPPC